MKITPYELCLLVTCLRIPPLDLLKLLYPGKTASPVTSS